MATRKGTYEPFLKGVSQQTPQQREDGQLGLQLNMLSDPVTGLRRRGGVKFHATLPNVSAKSYIRMVEIAGTTYIVSVDITTGILSVTNFATMVTQEHQWDYLKATSKGSIRTTMSRDNFFILNTDKIPTKEPIPVTGKDPRHYGYFSIMSSSFSKEFNVTLTHPTIGTKTFSVTTHASTAAQASPEWVATELTNAIEADVATKAFCTVTRSGTTVAIAVNDTTEKTGVLVVDGSTTTAYMVKSGASRVVNKSELLATLPPILDGYRMAVGNLGNTAYYQYTTATRVWKEVGKYEDAYKVKDEPIYFYMDNDDKLVAKTLDIQPRMAGDDDNNPAPKFIGYGITGIGAYQSRLVLLSGSYVNLSKTTEFNQFSRTTVTELLDDDAIEVSSAALSSAQFEYCVPYNKDLVLIAQNQQAVIPANSTVLTPKTAVVYPSTKVDLSLAAEPQIVSRSLYYTYQRGADYYQVGEFIPNTYTDAQYYNQNLTDHIPLYANGVCTSIAVSTTNNMVVCSADTNEVLINQYMWVGDERPLMSFHKWSYPHPVVYSQFIQEYLITFMDNGAGGILVGTQNVQLNQLYDKPIPYLDLYEYVTVVDGKASIPDSLRGAPIVASIYNSRTMRHKEVMITVQGNELLCPYEGVITLGVRFKSEFMLSPPFIKDENGKVVAGARSTINSLSMEFKNTGTFDVSVSDTMGVAYTGEGNTALTWSEADLGYSWVNSIGSVTIPCRTRLSSMECSVTTESTTDMNLVSCSYLIRLDNKYRRM